MARLIKDGAIVEDSWMLLRDAVDLDALASFDGMDIILPLSQWQLHHSQLSTRRGQTGVWLMSSEVPEALADSLPNIPLIALDFPLFSDGRAYSTARELRLNLSYAGELRAIGDVLYDQLSYMARCGFNAFAMREDQDLERALSRFTDFKEGYQASVDKPVPLFRRRA